MGKPVIGPNLNSRPRGETPRLMLISRWRAAPLYASIFRRNDDPPNPYGRPIRFRNGRLHITGNGTDRANSRAIVLVYERIRRCKFRETPFGFVAIYGMCELSGTLPPTHGYCEASGCANPCANFPTLLGNCSSSRKPLRFPWKHVARTHRASKATEIRMALRRNA